MQSFEIWYKDVTDDDIWFERMQMIHRGKDIREAAMLVWGEMSSDPEKHKFQTVQETRKWVHNKLVYMKPAPIKIVQNYQQVEKKEPEAHQPMTDEIWNLLEEYKQQLKSTARPIPKMSPEEIEKNGQVRPKAIKAQSTPPSIIRQMELHNQWVKECFDMYTAKPNENFMPEDEWLKINDK